MRDGLESPEARPRLADNHVNARQLLGVVLECRRDFRRFDIACVLEERQEHHAASDVWRYVAPDGSPQQGNEIALHPPDNTFTVGT